MAGSDVEEAEEVSGGDAVGVADADEAAGELAVLASSDIVVAFLCTAVSQVFVRSSRLVT